MKREELTALGIEGEALESVMALYGRDIEKHKTAQEQWQQKYRQDTDALREQLRQQGAAAAEDNAVRGLAFSSRSAESAFRAALHKAQLPAENGELQGFDAFLQQYRQTDAACFAAPETAKPPVFVKASSPDEGVSDTLRAAFGLD